MTHVLGVAYVASTPLGFVDVFWVQLGKDVFLVDVETGAIDMLGDVEATKPTPTSPSRLGGQCI